MELREAVCGDEHRIEALDVLRGWAVFGMLVVNVGYFGRQPLFRPEGIDAVAAIAAQILVAGKFWTLFSVLFGYGFALQLERAERRGEEFVGAYVGRLTVLLAIGLVHALLNPAEILHRYALLGGLLVLARRASSTTLVALATAAVLLTVVVPTGSSGGDPATAMQVYTAGSLGEVVAFNARTFIADAVDVRVMAPFPYFVLGVILGRSRFLHGAPAYREPLRRVRWWLLGTGLVLQAAPALTMLAWSDASRTVLLGLAIAVMGVGDGLIGLFYAAVVLLCLDHPAGRLALRPFVAVGRLALTNYLLQTLIVTTVLYGYGAGLYGQMGEADVLPIAVVIFVIQALASNWWMQRFRQGPVERLWRTLAQGRWQPI